MIATLEEAQNLKRASSRTAVASLEAVSKNYGEIRALRNVNFTVRAGQVVALLGPNGAGKTTAVKLLLGLMQPNSGKTRVFGGDPTNPQNRMRTGAMLQVGKVPETLRVREHIDLFSSYYPKPMPLEEVLAICGDPDLLFLDEPTVGLDVEARRALWEEIRRLVERGKTVLLTTHYLEEADALADRIAVINQGEIIAEGTPAEIKAQTGGKRIRCITALSRASLLQIPGVTDAKHDREAVEIRAREAEPVVRALLARDPSLSGLEITSAGLEEAFLALTQDNGENANRQN